MTKLEVVLKLMEENRLEEVIGQARKVILERRKKALLGKISPLFYCFSLDDACEKCSHPFIYCKIASEIIPDGSRKYPLIKCPECGNIEEYKRTSFWVDCGPGVPLADYKTPVPWENFQDLTQFFEG